jgi:hypothetical protein
MWAILLIFKNLPKVNNHPLGESSPNLVTLFFRKIRITKLLQGKQGDQIGRIFAFGAIANLARFGQLTEVAKIIASFFSVVKVLNHFCKNESVYFLMQFFNRLVFGHPA